MLSSCKISCYNFYCLLSNKCISIYLKGCSLQHSNDKDLVTSCQNCKITNTDFVCTMPTIFYGYKFSGVPIRQEPYSHSDYTQWCKELGFDGAASDPIATIPVHTKVNHALHWCSDKWCQVGDTYGYDLIIKELICKIGMKVAQYYFHPRVWKVVMRIIFI